MTKEEIKKAMCDYIDNLEVRDTKEWVKNSCYLYVELFRKCSLKILEEFGENLSDKEFKEKVNLEVWVMFEEYYERNKHFIKD